MNGFVSAVAAHDIGVSSGSMFQILVAISLAEFVGIVALRESLNGNRPAGNFGFDPLNLAGKDKVTLWSWVACMYENHFTTMRKIYCILFLLLNCVHVICVMQVPSLLNSKKHIVNCHYHNC